MGPLEAVNVTLDAVNVSSSSDDATLDAINIPSHALGVTLDADNGASSADDEPSSP
jgi:hypothetical protein